MKNIEELEEKLTDLVSRMDAAKDAFQSGVDDAIDIIESKAFKIDDLIEEVAHVIDQTAEYDNIDPETLKWINRESQTLSGSTKIEYLIEIGKMSSEIEVFQILQDLTYIKNKGHRPMVKPDQGVKKC